MVQTLEHGFWMLREVQRHRGCLVSTSWHSACTVAPRNHKLLPHYCPALPYFTLTVRNIILDLAAPFRMPSSRHSIGPAAKTRILHAKTHTDNMHTTSDTADRLTPPPHRQCLHAPTCCRQRCCHARARTFQAMSSCLTALNIEQHLPPCQVCSRAASACLPCM
jgi:hypothetical protein